MDLHSESFLAIFAGIIGMISGLAVRKVRDFRGFQDILIAIAINAGFAFLFTLYKYGDMYYFTGVVTWSSIFLVAGMITFAILVRPRQAFGGQPSTDTKPQDALPIPNWSSVLWITLGWGICWAVFTAINWAGVSYLITDTMGGAISGLIVALTLRSAKIISRQKSMVGLTLGLAITGSILAAGGWRTSLMGWAINGIIDGLIISVVLWFEQSLSNRTRILWIALGWSVGYVISYIASYGISYSNPAVAGAISGAISGAVGGFVLIWQVREGIEKK